jgi:hypothetical protein
MEQNVQLIWGTLTKVANQYCLYRSKLSLQSRMPASEEFSSPEVIEGENLSHAPVLHRQNADDAQNQMKSEQLNTCFDKPRGRLQNLGFGLSNEMTPDGLNPRVEWTKFFSDIWNTKTEIDAIQGHSSIDVSSDNMSPGDSSALFVRQSKSQRQIRPSTSLGTASIERKYPSLHFQNGENSLLLTKLRVKVGNSDFVTLDTSSSSKSTPPYVDPRIILRRKMMMRPSLAKQLAEIEQNDLQAASIKNQVEIELAAAKAAETKAKNMMLLSYRRKIMMRPSKVKQITELESNMRTLEAAIAQLRSDKMDLLKAEKKAENARLLAVRRQMMQRPSKTMRLSVTPAACSQKQALQSAQVDSSSALFESSLDELLEHFALGLQKGLIKADALVAQFEPTRSRAVYQSPLRVINANATAISKIVPT